MKPLPWDRVAAELSRSQRLVLGTHASPDGDALGSELGLARFLKTLGKEARIVNTGTLARMYGWMARDGESETYAPAVHDPLIASADAIVVVDISNWERLGPMHKSVMDSRAVRIDLDHHPVASCPADLSINDPSAAAVGVIVHELIGRMGGKVTPDIALPLYVSLLTDTGSFKYSNTDERTHRIAGEYIALGVQPYEVYTRTYECASPARLRLLGEVLRGMEADPAKGLVWASVPHALYGQTGATEEDTEGIIDQLRALEGFEVAALFKEVEPGVVKASLRSKRAVDVNAAVRPLGGGGHARAAGVTLKAPLDEARARVLGALRGA